MSSPTVPFKVDLDLRTLFCLIMVAKSLGIRRLMNFACQKLVKKVKQETFGVDSWQSNFIWEFISELDSKTRDCELKIDCGISRSRLICESDFVDAQRDCLFHADLPIGRRIFVFDDYICKFLKATDHTGKVH